MCLLFNKCLQLLKLFLFDVCDAFEWQYIIKNKIKPCMGDGDFFNLSLANCLFEPRIGR